MKNNYIYIVKKIVDLIKSQAPSTNDEMMIRIDNFDNVEIYESIAEESVNSLSKKGLKTNVKLAKNKYEYFKNRKDSSLCLKRMEERDWIAKDKSITYYRNLHSCQVLLLMGTEDEEDNGGLLNCYTITPDTLINDLSEKYHKLYTESKDDLDFTEDQILMIDKLYKYLFDCVAIDLCKLSKLVDTHLEEISVFEDFIEVFYRTLPEWGLPFVEDEENLLNKQSILKKQVSSQKAKSSRVSNNILKLEHDFISRQKFRNITSKNYSKYEEKIDKYEESDKKYIPSWEGWSSQKEIKSYNDLKSVLLSYILGEDVDINRQKLLTLDFSIIEDILDLKIKEDPIIKPNDKKEVITGEPLNAFTLSMLKTLIRIKENNEIENDVCSLRFKIIDAEIVVVYSDSEKELAQLSDSWKLICQHTNGIFDELNNQTWKLNNHELNIKCEPLDIFAPNKSSFYVNDSNIINSASSNKKLNTIEFKIECLDVNENEIVSYPYLWKFQSTEEWLNNFSDICNYICNSEQFTKPNNSSIVPYIPLSVCKNLSTLIFAKSEEEFFDIYSETTKDFKFNLIDFINNAENKVSDVFRLKFHELGISFSKFINQVSNYGFYSEACVNELSKLQDRYNNLGEKLISQNLPENERWLMDAYIHAFNIEVNTDSLNNDNGFDSCIVPPWHPASLEKIRDQKIFFLAGCNEWWNKQSNSEEIKYKELSSVIESLHQMGMIQSALDIFPCKGSSYFGAVNSFGSFTAFSNKDKKNNNRLKDIIRKEAIFDDDFDEKSNVLMTDNAKMLYGVLNDYMKAFPYAYKNFRIVFIDPSDLQPIVASIHKYIENTRSSYPNDKINIILRILVQPGNKGGKNYLAYWMDECFSNDSDVSIKTYLNEFNNINDIKNLIGSNNDLIFHMDLLKGAVFNIERYDKGANCNISKECRFPIVFKPAPVSRTNVRRRIELSQPQFLSSYLHTQVSIRRNNSFKDIPLETKYIAVKELSVDKDTEEIVSLLHQKAYWVVCIGGCLDGAVLRNNNKNDYSIIGFSTGKGAYGQYNLTITAKNSILDTIKKKLNDRLYKLFHWEQELIAKASEICINEAGKLDGISLLSAINPKNHNINEFMAYVLTSLREKETQTNNALKIIVHLDSFKHWFSCDTDSDSKLRPDFLILEVNLVDDKLQLNAIVTECKISSCQDVQTYIDKAKSQVEHGIKRLKSIFNPKSESVIKRYWFAQLYRALVFAQITFSDNTEEFQILSSKLRAILDGEFEINWKGRILGFWADCNSCSETEEFFGDSPDIKLYNIPQQRIQSILLNNTSENINYIEIDKSIIDVEQEYEKLDIISKQYLDEIERMSSINLINELNDGKASKIEVKSENNIKDEQKSTLSNTNDLIEQVSTEYTKNDSTIDRIKEDTLSINSGSESKLNKKTIELSDVRVLIGTDKASQKVYWEFGNKQLANRHLLITGTSGQGKTYSIQTMLYELSKGNVSSVIFDYTEGFTPNQLEKEFVSEMGSHINQIICKYDKVPINPFKRHSFEIFGEIRQDKDSDVASRFANIMTHVYKFGDQQNSAIFEAVRKGLEKYKDGMNMKYFQEELENEVQNNKAAQTVISKMTPFFYTIEFDDESSFDWNDVLYPKYSTSTIFQLTGLDREMQVIVTELMLWDLWSFSTKYGNKEKPFVVVLDEAQNLSHKDKSPSAKILTEGRKFGWSAWYATQSLDVLSTDEVTRLMQSAYKLYFRPTDVEITKIARHLDPSNSSSWINVLKNLKKGQSIVVGERLTNNNQLGIVKPTITNVESFSNRG